MSEASYNLKRDITIRVLEEIDEWTDNHGLETSADMEMELAIRFQEILKEKGLIKEE